jgi:hypothetical protein
MSKARVQCKKPIPHMQSPRPRGLTSTTIAETKTFGENYSFLLDISSQKPTW